MGHNRTLGTEAADDLSDLAVETSRGNHLREQTASSNEVGKDGGDETRVLPFRGEKAVAHSGMRREMTADWVCYQGGC